MASSYLDAILGAQAQRRVTGGGNLTSSQVEAAAQGDIAARYNAAASSRALSISQENADTSRMGEQAQEAQYASSLDLSKQQLALSQTTEAAREAEANRSANLQEEQIAGQKQGEMIQAGIMGTVAAGYAIPKIAPYVKDLFGGTETGGGGATTIGSTIDTDVLDTTTTTDFNFFSATDSLSEFDLGSVDWFSSVGDFFSSLW